MWEGYKHRLFCKLRGLIRNVYGIFVFVFILILCFFFGCCLIWALGGCNIGQKGGGRLIKILPARQTHFGDFFGQPFGKNTF